MTNFKSYIELLDHFKDQQTCIEHLEKQRWNGRPVCPFCGHDKVYKTNRGYKCASSDCYKKFTVTVGSVFENSKIPLRYWFAAIYLCAGHKKGISSHQLGRDLNISQKTAWFLLHRVREMLREKSPVMLSNDVEIDETFIGGKEKNKHRNKKTEGSQGRSVKTKSAVLGIIERKGKIVVVPVKNTAAETIQPIMVKTVQAGSNIHTDEWGGYSGLNKNYNHNVVRHGLGEYVVGLSHTNNVENFWSHLKRGITGIHHQVSEKHLHRYCDAQAFRFNTRNENESERFDTILQKCTGRLTYAALINKSEK